MRRVRLFIAYDGTDYCGWQIQPNGITIEEILNQKLSVITGEDIHVIGASSNRFRCACAWTGSGV